MSFKRAIVNICNIPVHNDILRGIAEIAALNCQSAARIVFDRVDTTVEMTAVDKKGGGSTRVAAVANQTGKTAYSLTAIVQSRGDSGTCIDSHGAVVLYGIPRISVAAIRLIGTGLLTTGKRTAIQNGGCTRFIIQCALAMSDIVDRAAAGNSQVAVIGNGVAAGIGQLVTVQVKGNGRISRDGDVLRGVSRQLDGDVCTFGEIIKSAEAREGAAGDRGILVIGDRNIAIKCAVCNIQGHLRCRIVILRVALIQSLDTLKGTAIDRNADVLLGGMLRDRKCSTFRGSATAVGIATIFGCSSGKGTAFNCHATRTHFNSSAAGNIGILNNNIGYACLIDAMAIRLDRSTVNGHFKAVAALQGSLHCQLGCSAIAPHCNSKTLV